MVDIYRKPISHIYSTVTQSVTLGVGVGVCVVGGGGSVRFHDNRLRVSRDGTVMTEGNC